MPDYLNVQSKKQYAYSKSFYAIFDAIIDLNANLGWNVHTLMIHGALL